MSRLVNMDRRSRLNFRKAVRLSVFHSAEVNVGHSVLGGKVRVFGILDVYTAMPFAVGRRKRKKKGVGTSCANFELEEGFNAGGRRSGLRWTPVDARDRAGPATLDSHGGDATRRLGVAGP
jgi:hypothetical protein